MFGEGEGEAAKGRERVRGAERCEREWWGDGGAMVGRWWGDGGVMVG